MKKFIFMLFAFLAATSLFLSCERYDEPSTRSITIDFAFPDDYIALTKSSSTSSLYLDDGGTAAMYAVSNGALLAQGSYYGSTRQVVIDNAPSQDCYVYAVANADFNWPSNRSSLSSQAIPVDVMSGYMPHSTTESYDWSVGTSRITVHLTRLYGKIIIDKSGGSINALSASVTKCPTHVYPFADNAYGTSGETDEATSSDLHAFETGGQFTLYVPSDGNTEVEIICSQSNGYGINLDQNYTISVPAIQKGETNTFTIAIGDENASLPIDETGGIADQEMEETQTDTRRVEFSTNEITFDENATVTVRGYCGNGDNGQFTYSLSWSGVSALSGTRVKVDNGSWNSLGSSNSINLTSGSDHTLTFQVNSFSSEAQTHLTAAISGGDSDRLDVTVEEREPTITGIEIIRISNNPYGDYVHDQGVYQFKALVTFSNGTVIDSSDPYYEQDFDWWATSSDSGRIQSNDGYGQFHLCQTSNNDDGTIVIHVIYNRDDPEATYTLYCAPIRATFTSAEILDESTQTDINNGLYRYGIAVTYESFIGNNSIGFRTEPAVIDALSGDGTLQVYDLTVDIAMYDAIENGPVSSYPAPASHANYIRIDYVDYTDANGNHHIEYP